MSDLISNTYSVPDDWRTLSSIDNSARQVGDNMGKLDFLMLLSAQLRYQDPMEPAKDSDFAAQLAQFSALEQMQNMNTTLAAMANYQAFSLTGKLAVATAYVDGTLTNLFGTVDAVFTQDGVTYAQISGYQVPISAITDVIDNTNALTPNMLIEASNNLIGRTVKAEVNKNTIEGIVTSAFVTDGELYARIADSATGKEIGVPIGCIYDIRQTGLAETADGDEDKIDNEDDKPIEDLLIEAQNNLVGQLVSALVDDEEIEGVVTRVEEDGGAIYAYVDDGSGDEKKVPIESAIIVQQPGNDEI